MPSFFRSVPRKIRLVGGRTWCTFNGSSTAPAVIPPKLSNSVAYEATGVLATINGTSTSSPNWAVPKPRYVQVRADSPPPPVPPVAPIYRPLPEPQPPVRKDFLSPGSWTRRRNRFLRDYNRWSQIESVRRKKFDDGPLARYLVKKAKYDQIYDRWLSKLYETELKAKGQIVPTVNNPYSKTFFRDTDLISKNYLATQTGRFEPVPGSNPTQYNLKFGIGPVIWMYEFWNGNTANRMTFINHSAPVSDSLGVLSATPAILNAEGRARESLFEKLSDQQVHVGNILAERAQAYNTIVSSFQRLQAFVRSPKKAVLGYISGKPSKKVANDLLQYCFGIEPLARDLFAAVSAAGKAFQSQTNSDMVRVSSVTGVGSVSRTSTVNDTFFTDTYTTEIEVKARYVCEYRITSPIPATLKNFGLLNPAEILWEVTPWSFLIDWVLPIGNAIQALSADAGLTFKSGTYSTEITTVKTFRRVYKYDAAMHKSSGWTYSGELTREITTVTKDRSVLSGPPVPGFPRFKNPFSPRHVALSLSLWRQRVP